MEDIIDPVRHLSLSLMLLSTVYFPQIKREDTPSICGKLLGPPVPLAMSIIWLSLTLYRYPFHGTIQVPISEMVATLFFIGAGMSMLVAALLTLKKWLAQPSKTDLTPQSHPSRTPPAP